MEKSHFNHQTNAKSDNRTVKLGNLSGLIFAVERLMTLVCLVPPRERSQDIGRRGVFFATVCVLIVL